MVHGDFHIKNLMKQNDEVRNEFSQRFKHILVDEFQDTNKTQYEFIRMLFDEEKDTDSDYQAKIYAKGNHFQNLCVTHTSSNQS